MLQTNYQEIQTAHRPIGFNRSVGIISVVFMFMVGLTIFQDYLESGRVGHSFYFTESILFKTIWILFIPVLAILYKSLKISKFKKPHQLILLILAAVTFHIIINSIVMSLFSFLFYHGRYGFYKTFSYTIANDLYKIVAVYSLFMIGYNYLSKKLSNGISQTKTYLTTIAINSGRNNSVISVNDIFHISAATPYISVQLENKKHLHTDTLKSLSENLNPQTFVRVHKSTIVNVDKVISFKSRLNGDYDILLKNDDEIRLSRTYASNFKTIVNSTHQVDL